MQPTEKQLGQLIRYLKDKRHNGMVILWIVAAVAFLTTVPGIQDLTHIGSNGIRDGADGDMTLLWLVSLITTLVLVLRGWGKTLGKGCDLDCVQKGQYLCAEGTCSRKEENAGKAPYFLYDTSGSILECARFVDYRNAVAGSRLLCLTLANGKQYCFLLDEEL